MQIFFRFYYVTKHTIKTDNCMTKFLCKNTSKYLYIVSYILKLKMGYLFFKDVKWLETNFNFSRFFLVFSREIYFFSRFSTRKNNSVKCKVYIRPIFGYSTRVGVRFIRTAAILMAAVLTNFGPLPKSQSPFYLTPTLYDFHG